MGKYNELYVANQQAVADNELRKNDLVQQIQELAAQLTDTQSHLSSVQQVLDYKEIAHQAQLDQIANEMKVQIDNLNHQNAEMSVLYAQAQEKSTTQSQAQAQQSPLSKLVEVV